MKWQRSDLNVLLGLLAVLVLVGVGVWATVPGVRFRGMEFHLQVERIDRLETGAQVLVEGYPVGQVRSIEPVSAAGGLDFLVVLSLREAGGDSPLVLRRGTWAEITVEGLFGSPVVVLHPSPDPGAAALEEGSVIPVRPGAGGMSEVLRRVPPLLERVDSVVARVPGLLERMERILANAEVASDTIRLAASDARTLTRTAVRDVRELLAEARASLREVQEVTDRTRGGLDTVLAGATDAVDSAAVVIEEATLLVRELDATAAEAEVSVTAILRELRETAHVLNNMAREISDRPYRLLTGVTPPPEGSRPDAPPPPDSGGGGPAPGSGG